MNAFLVLLNKEWTEAVRTSKLIWLPAVFAILGITQPVLAKFMPDILKSAGSLPKGAVIDIPIAAPGEVLGQTLSQFGSIGILAVCLGFMGMISAERRSGAAAWVLVKPVSPLAYLLSKWSVSMLITLASFAVGYAAAWYETSVLIGTPDTALALKAGIAYAGWLALIVTAVLAAGAWMNAPAAAAFIPFAGATVLQIVQGFGFQGLKFLPSSLASQAINSLRASEPLAVWGASATTVAALALFVWLAIGGVRTRPLNG
ncbi:ABC transporter permease subunit [Cohnella candidum]|uniref:ABC transporter permease n=1 Tax=Cohnella candidum TaxID=2674991 RepID=A0A3G3JSW5_9BACL|nr:ABC transporter permease [Cohnella candidum]AYQ71284.1 ABC transporter permease [Cohnella candidum]